jgi:hypothetical protein
LQVEVANESTLALCAPLDFCFGAIARLGPQPSLPHDTDHTEWVGGVLNATQSIKVGMTRSDLLKVFTTEGGLSWSSQRTYAYRQCPYIKVDVSLQPQATAKSLQETKSLTSRALSSRGWC